MEIKKIILYLFAIIMPTSCVFYESPLLNVEGDYLLSLNQNNNIQYFSFAIKLGDYLYLADGKGIHKIDRNLENKQTLFSVENQNRNRSVISNLQYHNGNIYFLNGMNASIYSMDIKDYFVTRIISSYEIGEIGAIDHFIVTPNEIFMRFFLFNGLDTDLVSFNFYTNKIEVFDFNAEMTTAFAISQNKDYLYLSYNFVLGALNLESRELINNMPTNSTEIDILSMIFRTYVDGRMIFSNYSNRTSILFATNEYNYAEKIYEFPDIHVSSEINAVGKWIYFTQRPLNSIYLHLYRIKNDGSNLELVYPKISYMNPGIPFLFFNVFSEDLIVFRISQQFHETYALIRDEHTGELIRRRLN